MGENMITTGIKGVLAAIAAGITWLFGGWDMLMLAVCILMGIDYITGLISAGISGHIDSRVGFKGILKKVAMLLVIAAAALIDKLALPGTDTVRNIVCLFYIGNEGVSIIENLGRANVPIPKKLAKVFERLKEKDDEEE